MTGEGVKREISAWSWQKARPDPPHFLFYYITIFGTPKIIM